MTCPRKRRRKSASLVSLAVGALLLLALVIAGCGSSSDSATADSSSSSGSSSSDSGSSGGKTEIKYGTENYVVNMPELADALGYIPNIELKPVTNGLTIPPAQFIQTVLSGEVTYGFSNFGGLITANAQGQKVKAVIAFNGNAEGAAGGFYVKSDSDIHSAQDLVGKKVAIVPGTLSELELDLYLKQNGIEVDEVEHVSVSYAGNGGEQEVRSGELDAFSASGNQKIAAEERGGLRQLVSEQEILGTIELDAYFFADKWIEENPEAIKEFVSGTAKAIVWSQTHPVKQVLAKYIAYLNAHGQGSEAEAFAGYQTNGDLKGGLITEQSFTDNVEWLELIGQLQPGQVKPEDVYTNEFNPYKGQVPGT
jgi:ABC-type nitrate/sulfonate/bicarbonate transport system substrate-binding protein